jgi:1-acyl-sn-glycerol-3-phosphate acyltransferase
MTDTEMVPLLYFGGRAALRAFFTLACRWEVEGREQVPAEGGVILAANHTSYVDPPLVGAALHRVAHYLGKAELFRIPGLGWFLERVNVFPVRRGAADLHALRTSLGLLRSGEVLLVFPEGTRSRDGRLMPAELGVAMIALRSGAPVVPLALLGTDRVLPRGWPVILPAKIRVRFGQPLRFDEFAGRAGDRQALEQVSQRITQAIAALLPPNRISPEVRALM